MPWNSKSSPTEHADAREDVAADPTADRSEQESRLRRLVSQGVAESDAGRDADRQKVLYKRPYYFRTYSVYPNASDMDIKIRETDTRVAPLQSDVKLEKQRFSTRLHTRREDASADTNFLRDTGTETITYELRNGRWTRTGSFFLADKTEEQINGEWVPLEEQAQRELNAPEERREGVLRRTWNRVTGR